MLKKHLTIAKYSRLSKNPQAIILYKIIQYWFPLNYLQKNIIKKVLNYTFLNKRY